MDLSLTLIFLSVVAGYIIWKVIYILNRYRLYRNIVNSGQAQTIGKFHPIWGHTHLFNEYDELINLLNRAMLKTRAKVLYFWVMFLFPVILVVHADTAKIFLKSSEPKSKDIGGIYHFIQPWLGDGLLLSNGKKWFRNRRLLTPAFHYDILRSYMRIYNNVVTIFLKKLTPFAESQESTDITKSVSKCTLDTMLRCAFSFVGNVQDQGKEDHPYIRAIMETLRLASDRSRKPWKFYYPLYKLMPSGRKFVKAIDYIHNFDEVLISKRREALKNDDSYNKEKDSKPGRKQKDFVDILISARDENGEGLTDLEIRDEVDTFLFEGYDTSSSGLSWSIYALGQHQDVQQRIYEEIKALKGNEEHVDWDDLHKMPILTAFIRESMRVYTPVPGVARLTTDFIDVDGVTIPPNVEVIILCSLIHRNPDTWPDPEKFRIERFLEEDINARDPYSYVPFSAGPRNCIGQIFAMNEIKVTLIRLLQRFKILPDPDHVPEQLPQAVLRSKHGIKIKLEART